MNLSKVLDELIAGLITAAILAIATLILRRIGISGEYVIVIVTTLGLLILAVYWFGKRPFRLILAALTARGPVSVFWNQLECEQEIVTHFARATSIKVLTARGYRYFSGTVGWFADALKAKAASGYIYILHCSPESKHITEDLARQWGYSSQEEFRQRMRIAQDILRDLAQRYPNIQVREYEEAPIWNMLIFDDVLYVFAYVGKDSHKHAVVYKMMRNDKAQFAGFEKYFNQLWAKSTPLR